jgi:hypothetical protein
MTAVQNHGSALQFVQKQTFELCLAAVQNDESNYGWAFRYVTKQTPEICMAAVQNSGFALNFVEKQTYELCMAAVQNNGDALLYVREQTPELCMAAITNNINALKYCKFRYKISYTIINKPTDDCMICCDNGNDKWCQLNSCKHSFHIKCIKMCTAKKCPLCRKSFAYMFEP